MGLQQNLNDIQTNLLAAKTAIAQSISNKGVECSADEALSTYASKIDSISGGSTGNKIMLTDGTKFAYSKAFEPELYDVSQVTDMSQMFYNCKELTTIDLSTWDVSNVTDMENMFCYCSGLTSINVSNWNTSNVTRMDTMFSTCYSLTSLDLSNLNTSNVTSMKYMFESCRDLTSLDLSNFDTGKLISGNSMFTGCEVLTTLNLSNLNTSNVTSMKYMFLNCKSLTNLQLNDLGHKQSCTEFDLTPCSALTKDSILYLFNNAFDRASAGYITAFTIKLHSNTKALLSEDELSIATNKGFTVV